MILDFGFERMNATHFCLFQPGSRSVRDYATPRIKNQKSKIKNS
jgi:hypothetical protein